MNSPSNEENDLVRRIDQEFSDCLLPKGKDLVGAHGAGAADMQEAWGNLDKYNFGDLKEFDFELGCGLDYMSSSALRYFFPEIMKYHIRFPSRCYADGFSFVIDVLEMMFGLGKENRGSRAVRMSERQRETVSEWLRWLIENIKRFDLAYEEENYVVRLKHIRHSMPLYDVSDDYDAEGKL